MKRILYITILALGFASCSNDVGEFLGSDNEVLSGSYANMLTFGNYLYLLGEGSLKTYDLDNPEQPSFVNSQFLSHSIESLFINNGDLFIGSPEGMFIYTIGGDGVPQLQSQTEYELFDVVLPCDPITANNDFAYVTLSTAGSIDDPCFRVEPLNELRVFDIENLSNPIQINMIDMDEPKGLGLDGDHLFVCESKTGLKVFDVTDPLNLEQIYHFPGFQAFDLIPANGLLMVVGQDTLHQFDYSDIENMTKISSFGLQD